MEFRLALQTDLPDLYQYYQSVCKPMEGHVHNARWSYGLYPTQEEIEQYTKEGNLYLLSENDTILGAAAITNQQQKGYENVNWKIEAPYAILHLVSIAPNQQKKGLGRILLDAIMQMLKEKKIASVHIDCIKENEDAIGMYLHYGFTDHGLHSIFYEDTGWMDYRILEYPL